MRAVLNVWVPELKVGSCAGPQFQPTPLDEAGIGW